jgi:FAD/FMN-containing dehydrogenase
MTTTTSLAEIGALWERAGHNGGGLGVVDDGVVIDLAGIAGIVVGSDVHTVRVGGGCTWGEVDRATRSTGARRR